MTRNSIRFLHRRTFDPIVRKRYSRWSELSRFDSFKLHRCKVLFAILQRSIGQILSKALYRQNLTQRFLLVVSAPLMSLPAKLP